MAHNGKEIFHFAEKVIATVCVIRRLVPKVGVLAQKLEEATGLLKVQLVRWSPPIEKKKTKVNTDASISDDGQCFIGFVMFDFRGIHHFRYAKKCISGCLKVNRDDTNYDVERQRAICEAEARAIREAIRNVIQRECLPADIETDNSIVSAAINAKGHEKKDELSTSFWAIIRDIHELIGSRDIKVKWISRKQNRAADHVANSARKSTIQDFHLKKRPDEFDEKITYKTWIAMYGGSQVIISEEQGAKNHEIDDVKDICYVFSKYNHDAQTIKKWIDEGLLNTNRNDILSRIVFQISEPGTLLWEQYNMFIDYQMLDTNTYISEDLVIRNMIGVMKVLKDLPPTRTISLFLEYKDKKSFPSQLYSPCSFTAVKTSSNLKPLTSVLGSVKLNGCAMRVELESFYDPKLCVDRIASNRKYNGDKQGVKQWLKEQDKEYFSAIDVLANTKIKSQAKLNSILNELINCGILEERETNLYIVQRQQLEEELGGLRKKDKLKPKRIKENKGYIYKVVNPITQHIRGNKDSDEE